jgi:hypothetical protein
VYPIPIRQLQRMVFEGEQAEIRRAVAKRVDSGAEAVRRVVLALVDVPYAAGRRHLVNGEPPPPLVDELVTQTLQRVLFDRPETGRLP